MKIENTLIFISLLLFESFLFVRLKFKLELPAKISLLLYLFVGTLRFAKVFIDPKTVYFTVLSRLSTTLIWTALYYFIFEMNSVLLIIVQSDHSKYQI